MGQDNLVAAIFLSLETIMTLLRCFSPFSRLTCSNTISCLAYVKVTTVRRENSYYLMRGKERVGEKGGEAEAEGEPEGGRGRGGEGEREGEREAEGERGRWFIALSHGKPLMATFDLLINIRDYQT